MSSSLALSQPLLRWLREDPAWAALPLAQRARLAWQARWGSINSGVARALAAQGTLVALEDPVLIVGPWRSGTTVMHELLGAALGSTTPLTWQCMDACSFELLPHRHRGGRDPVVARPMDGLQISGESPQEDEFALLALGIDSAYRAFWMPQRIGELQHTLDPQYWLDQPQWLDAWEAFLRGVLRTATLPRQPLILKSPNHTYRLRAILQRFPRTHVVWMARDPAAIWHSNRKMWSSMFAAHGLSASNSDALDAFLVRALEEAASTLDWCSQNLDHARWTVVRQEALQADPVATMQGVQRALELQRETNSAAFDAAVARIGSGRVERYAQAPPPVALPAIEALRGAQDAALAA